MKLLMLKNASLPGLDLQAGTVRDVEEPHAANLLKAGCAKPAPSPAGRSRPGTPAEAEVRLRRLREACVDCGMPEPVIGDIIRSASMLMGKTPHPPAAPSPNGKPPEPPAGETDSKPSDEAEAAAKLNEDPPPAVPRKPNPRRPGG